MTRVCLKSDSDATGRIIGSNIYTRPNEVLVKWDDMENPQNISREVIRPLLCADLIGTLERLRDAMNLALGCAIEDIKRVRS